MREEKLGFSVIFRMLISLLPILFGMPPFVAVILCAYNIAMSFLVFGPITGTVSSLSAICISMFFFGTYGESQKLTGLFIGLEAILCAIAVFYSVLKSKSFYSGVWLSAGAYLVPFFFQLRSVASKVGMSVAGYMSDAVVSVFREESKILLEESPQLVDAVLLKKMESFLATLCGTLVPSMLILCSIMVGYVVMWCVCAQLRKTKNPIHHSFAMIKMPRLMVILLVLAAALVYIDIDFYVSAVAINVCVILTTLCFFAGMSFVDFHMRKTGRRLFSRIVVHFLVITISSSILVSSPLLNVFTVYVIIAVVDSFANFRKIGKTEPARRVSSETEK